MLTFSEWAAAAAGVDVAGLRIAVHDDGDPSGPVVTFLHGYPSSSLDVVPVLERLADVRVVTLDFPGFGASDKPPGHEHSIHGAADAVEAVWHALGVSSSALLAHDYGVSVAQELLARQADAGGAPAAGVAVTGVVWTNGGLYSDLHRATVGQQLLLDPEHGAEVAAAMDEAALAAGIRGTWGARRPMSDDEVHQMWCGLAHGGGARQAHRLLHYVADRRRYGDRWIPALETCPLPMRFVWGELDPVSGGHVADRLAVRLPHVPLQRLDDVGHWPPLEAPDEVAAAVRQLVAPG
jgi:pimeloyl-ACP methyl ester carboxylesterase